MGITKDKPSINPKGSRSTKELGALKEQNRRLVQEKDELRRKLREAEQFVLTPTNFWQIHEKLNFDSEGHIASTYAQENYIGISVYEAMTVRPVTLYLSGNFISIKKLYPDDTNKQCIDEDTNLPKSFDRFRAEVRIWSESKSAKFETCFNVIRISQHIVFLGTTDRGRFCWNEGELTIEGQKFDLGTALDSDFYDFANEMLMLKPVDFDSSY